MNTQMFVKRTRIEAPAQEVFAWHTRPGALERLIPPWESIRVIDRSGGVEDGARVTLKMRRGPVCVRWIAEHRDYQEGIQFRDVQIVGPFTQWEHTHRVDPEGPEACDLEDRVDYTLPLGGLGTLMGGGLARRMLQRLFDYRHRTTLQDISAQRQYDRGTPMKILISGSTGLIGSALVPFLTTGGHQVTRLVRMQPRPDLSAVLWDPARGRLDVTQLEGYDAVVHLAGEHLSSRWTPEQKARIRDSRVKGTQLLCESLAQLDKPPDVLVCASAIGYYGDRAHEILTEDSPPGTGFLAAVCRAWEVAAAPAAKQGIRVVHLRFGVVLSPAGGALAQMLPPFQLGFGGRLGSGDQYLSWIGVDDAVGAILHALMTETLRGPVNAVAPQALTNADFTKTLGHVLGRPTWLPLPAWATRVIFGEMADALLLASARVEPSQLLRSGYTFRFPQLDGALRHVLGK